MDAVTCSEAGLALAAGVLGVRADLPVPREQGREGHDRLRKVNHEPLGPWRQESPRPWVAKPPSSPQPDPPSTHLPCRRRRAFFSRTHSRLFLTTPRLAILYGTLWGDRAVSKGTEQPKLAPRCSRAEKCGKSPARQAASVVPILESPFLLTPAGARAAVQQEVRVPLICSYPQDWEPCVRPTYKCLSGRQGPNYFGARISS